MVAIRLLTQSAFYAADGWISRATLTLACKWPAPALSCVLQVGRGCDLVGARRCLPGAAGVVSVRGVFLPLLLVVVVAHILRKCRLGWNCP